MLMSYLPVCPTSRSEIVNCMLRVQSRKQLIIKVLSLLARRTPKEVRITIMVVHEKKLNEFVEKVGNEWGASMGALINFVGDKLGLFKAMAGAGALTPEE